jgi:replicative DNA helicase
VRDRAILRRALGLAMEIMTAVHGAVEDAATLASSASSRFADIAAHGGGDGALVTMGSAATEVATSADVAQRSGGRAPGLLPTGFRALDALVGGWHPGHFVAIGGVPGTGKSAFMLSSLRAATRAAGTWALVVTEEMAATEVAERAVANESGINSMDLRSGRLQGRDWAQLDGAVHLLQLDKILFAPPGTNTVDKIHAVWRKAKAQVERRGEKMGAIAVDYLQLMHPSHGRGGGGNRVEELTEITRGLKCLFMAERVPGLVLSSFNRAGVGRTDPRPVMGDFRGSGSIESDANVMIGLYSEFSASAGRAVSASAETVEAHVLKARNGRLGVVPLPFVRQAASFRTDSGDAEVETWHDRERA